MGELVNIDVRDRIAHVTIENGKANALSPDVIAALDDALFARMYGSAVPIVVACTGHAVAAGALLLLGADYRVGARGEFQIGLIETKLGMVLPQWAVELAQERLSKRHLQQATVGA